ncbi:ABCG5 family protein [Megaselia abdita]
MGDGCLGIGGEPALILRDINFAVRSGEVMAILGSKGSGKRALLDVISHRVESKCKGQILLNGVPLTKSLFQNRCAYVSQDPYFIPGLTVAQTLHYTPARLTGYLKSSKVRQVLADLALTQVAKKYVENLNISEKRRLSIGVQLVRDPVMILLDEPTQYLNPLNAYLLISILSNISKKCGCGIILSLEKPRSDVFPFLDKALFLCLGGVVYSGGTRTMLEYFHNIGFPCPQLENPLMYYLCLSTVDRRSRDRFVESSQQIDALIERFSREPVMSEINLPPKNVAKYPISYGKPTELKVWFMILMQMMLSIFSCGTTGIKFLCVRLFMLPLIFAIYFPFFFNLTFDHHGFFSKKGLILNLIGWSYGCGMIPAIAIYKHWRDKFMKDKAEGLYSGGTLLLAYNIISIGLWLISTSLATIVIYPLMVDTKYQDYKTFAHIVLAVWSCCILAEQISITFLLYVKQTFNSLTYCTYIVVLLIILATGTVRSYAGLHPLLQDVTKTAHSYYVSSIFYSTIFTSHQLNCIPTASIICPKFSEYLFERIGNPDPNEWQEVATACAFALALMVFNMVLYLFPLPKFVKKKFYKQIL